MERTEPRRAEQRKQSIPARRSKPIRKLTRAPALLRFSSEMVSRRLRITNGLHHQQRQSTDELSPTAARHLTEQTAAWRKSMLASESAGALPDRAQSVTLEQSVQESGPPLC